MGLSWPGSGLPVPGLGLLGLYLGFLKHGLVLATQGLPGPPRAWLGPPWALRLLETGSGWKNVWTDMRKFSSVLTSSPKKKTDMKIQDASYLKMCRPKLAKNRSDLTPGQISLDFGIYHTIELSRQILIFGP